MSLFFDFLLAMCGGCSRESFVDASCYKQKMDGGVEEKDGGGEGGKEEGAKKEISSDGEKKDKRRDDGFEREARGVVYDEMNAYKCKARSYLSFSL